MSRFQPFLECSACAARSEIRELVNLCTVCGGPLLVRYSFHRDPALRQEIAKRAPKMWRYAEVLPIEKLSEAVTLGECITPLLPLRVHADVFIKDQSKNPTCSFKSRCFAAALTMAKH